jgi:hypothetical protein
MFFIDHRLQFFRPLTSKYREQIIECLRLLYQRLYSADADYGHALNRDQIIEIFAEALVRAPQLESGQGDDEQRFRNNREQASWTLNQLLDNGWIERQVDPATLHTSYPFSRMGRLFTQPLVEAKQARVRTRHRNTRNTLNALEAFASRGEVHDLLDAMEYSERIIADFTDIISELEERKRELVREVESQQLVAEATEQFFDFMEKRFMPDVSVRLSADSVEKHRDQLSKVVSRIRRKDTAFKKAAEAKLRELVPELVQGPRSVLWYVLDTIELRMQRAAEVMLPALRHALHGFTKRADIIIRQLSYLHSQHDSSVVEVCQQLAQLPAEQQNQRLAAAAANMAAFGLGLVDPAQIKLQQRRRAPQVQTAVAEAGELDQGAHCELLVQQLLDQAFIVNDQLLYDSISRKLVAGEPLSSAELSIETASDLLAAAHVVELGAINQRSSQHRFLVQPTGRQLSNDYYQSFDEFTITLVTDNHDQ